MSLNASLVPATGNSSNPNDPGFLAVCMALEEFGHTSADVREELEGGASTRQFFRVHLRGQLAIAMYTPAPSQEIAKARQSIGYGPFVEVAGLLSVHNIPTPQILAAAKTEPVLFVQDLGEHTLASYLVKHPETRQELYKKAVATLAHAQIALSPLPASSVIRTRAFDYDLLRWEVDHFRDWALAARDISLSKQDNETFASCAQYLAQTISAWETGFVHRDYQSRNIMIQGDLGGEQLSWIDFQDAMMGPRVYDLVALLTDSYQSFTPEFISARLDEYCAIRGWESQRELIGQEFSLVSVQRKLKDAGRFVFLEQVNKNDSFLRFVEPTIVKARLALRQVRNLGPLSQLDDMLEKIFGPLP